MNINAIRSGDVMDVLSSLKSPIKQPQGKTEASKKTEVSNDQLTTLDNKLSTDQNTKLNNDAKLQEKPTEDEKQKTSMKDANNMVDELNDYMDDLQTSLGFSVTKDPSNQIVFQIKDRSTNEVIKQIPSEEIQKIKEKMDELTGLLLDQHA